MTKINLSETTPTKQSLCCYELIKATPPLAAKIRRMFYIKDGRIYNKIDRKKLKKDELATNSKKGIVWADGVDLPEHSIYMFLRR